MNSKAGGRHRYWLGLGSVFALLLFVVSFPAERLSKFYGHLNSFSYGVRNYDRDVAVQGLENLKNDYNDLSTWRLQYFADRYLFDKTYRYDAAASVLNEDFEHAEEVLKNRENDHLASYILGIAKFKALHIAFQRAMAKKDKKQMAVILELVLEEVRPDFENCVKKGPGPTKNFNCSFNYDLTSDPKAAQRTLMNRKQVPKVILGIPDGQKPGVEKPDKKGPPRLGPNDDRDAGWGGARKVG